mgnify:CR=1 FL=1
MESILRLLIPDTCKRQLHRAADHNRDAVSRVLCTLEECAPALVGEMKAERRDTQRRA